MVGYTSDVFQDSLVYAEHANKTDLDLDDIQLAIQGRVNHSFTTPPPKEVCSCSCIDIIIENS
jgi:transcription initiation factor TFIID subunit 9B